MTQQKGSSFTIGDTALYLTYVDLQLIVAVQICLIILSLILDFLYLCYLAAVCSVILKTDLSLELRIR